MNTRLYFSGATVLAAVVAMLAGPAAAQAEHRHVTRSVRYTHIGYATPYVRATSVVYTAPALYPTIYVRPVPAPVYTHRPVYYPAYRPVHVVHPRPHRASFLHGYGHGYRTRSVNVHFGGHRLGRHGAYFGGFSFHRSR